MDINQQYDQIIGLFSRYIAMCKRLWVMRKYDAPIYYVMEALDDKSEIFEELGLCKSPSALYDCLLDYITTTYYYDHLVGDPGYTGDHDTDIIIDNLSPRDQQELTDMISGLDSGFLEIIGKAGEKDD